MKKRYMFVAAVVLLSVSLMVLTRTKEEVTVEAQRLKPQRIEQTVTCSGIIEAGEQEGVFAEIGCVVSEICVKAGQAVAAGDVVAKVDKELTKKQQKYPSAALAVATMSDEICAPSDGIVIAVTANEGEWLSEGNPCVLIANRDDLQIRVAIAEKHLTQVKCGQRVTVSGAGLQGGKYKGTLEEISAAVSSSDSGNMIEGVVRLDAGEADPSFRLGLSAKAKIITQVTEDGVLIPYEAVVKNEENTSIYLVRNGIVHKHLLNHCAELSSGVLVNGEELANAVVVTEPQMVTEGQTVRVCLKGMKN